MPGIRVIVAGNDDRRGSGTRFDPVRENDRFLSGQGDGVTEFAHNSCQCPNALRVRCHDQHADGVGEHFWCSRVHAGLASMVTMLVTVAPARAIIISMALPIFAGPSWRVIWPKRVAGTPPAERTISPATMPALAPGL